MMDKPESDRRARGKQPPRMLPAVAAAAALLALGGCGSGATKTVSVSSAQAPGTPTKRTSTTGTNSSSPTTTTHTNTGTSTNGASAVETTRTGGAPAFTKQSASAEGLSAAQAVVRAHGYTAGASTDYRPAQTLRVLVGTRRGSSDGYGQQAFFFVDGRYLGTDTSQPSATVKVVDQSDTEVTLAYPSYKSGDPLSKPSGGEKTVRFQLNNGRLVALGQIPSLAARTSGE
jgi:LppP/LprE lipoprotein